MTRSTLFIALGVTSAAALTVAKLTRPEPPAIEKETAVTFSSRSSPSHPAAKIGVGRFQHSDRSPLSLRQPLPVLSPLTPESQQLCDDLAWESRECLRDLMKIVDLSPDQKQEVFGLLVRSDRNFKPSVLINDQSISALSPAQAEAAILDLLTPSQLDFYTDDLIERQEWWEEIVTNLEDDLDTEEAPTTPTEPLPSQEGFSLFGQ